MHRWIVPPLIPQRPGGTPTGGVRCVHHQGAYLVLFLHDVLRVDAGEPGQRAVDGDHDEALQRDVDLAGRGGPARMETSVTDDDDDGGRKRALGSQLAINATTVSDLISEHTLISGHPPHFVLVEIIARACRDLCVLAVLHHAIDIWC